MGLFSAAKLFGMTLRESATDGSDFTNPDADYRRLFLGEDGALHLKDSAGAVTDVGGGGGLATARAKRTSGNITCNSASWANLDNGLDLVVAAAEGDVLLVQASGVWANEAYWGYLDAATIVSGAPVNYISGGAGGAGHHGITGWLGFPSVYANPSGGIQYVVVAGDISGGNVTLRLRYHVNSGAKTLVADSNDSFWWSVVNLGQ